MSLIIELLGTAALAMTIVTIWTLRVAVTARGAKAMASILSATEAMLFIVAFSRLIENLDSIQVIGAYGFGMAAGTWAALSLDGRLNPQLSRVDIFDPTGEAIDAVVAAGFPFTRSDGFGSEGRVSVASIITPEARVREVIDMVGASGPNSFWTVAPVRRAHDVHVPTAHRHTPGRRRIPAQEAVTSPQRTAAAAHV